MKAVLKKIEIDRSSRQAIYLQISNQLMKLIRQGDLRAGFQLPSTRALASDLCIHRKTVVQAYEELQSQGWVDSHIGRGSFVAVDLPEMNPQRIINASEKNIKTPLKAGFSIPENIYIKRELVPLTSRYHLDDGFPDARLAPLQELARAYRRQLLTGNPNIRLGYGDPKGSIWLREELAKYLNETRGLRIGPENLIIVRGTMMGVHLVSRSLLTPGDRVIVTDLSWAGASMNFLGASAELIRVPVDEFGMDIQAVEKICRRKKIRLLYITSHHDHPTTVALRAERRIALLHLSVQYGFIILEDDYDYDFHYLSKPYLPLASADQTGQVLYCGSFTKNISPAFRVGYVAGPANAIDHISICRRMIDRQGDFMLENAIAELLRDGIIQRHLRKSLRAYRERRDHFCKLMTEQLGNRVEFRVPDGGMAVWAHFSKKTDLLQLSRKAALEDIYVNSHIDYKKQFPQLNATRLGFASSTIPELEHIIPIIARLI